MFAFQNFLNFDINLKPISVSSKCIIKVLTELKSFREINRCYVIYSNEAVKCFFELGWIIISFFLLLNTLSSLSNVSTQSTREQNLWARQKCHFRFWLSFAFFSFSKTTSMLGNYSGLEKDLRIISNEFWVFANTCT